MDVSHPSSAGAIPGSARRFSEDGFRPHEPGWPRAGFRAIARLAPALLATVAGTLAAADPGSTPPVPQPPNVVFILADDLGWGDVSYQGQQLIATPHIDRLAVEGMRFTHHYAGSAVCAPSRCTLLTGRHTGHCVIRDNLAVGPDGGEIRPALGPEAVTVADVFHQAGYVTGAIGKWGLGDEGTTGVPWQQGFDHFFGYLHNTHGTRYYTEFIYRNAEKIALRGNYGHWRNQYGPELCLQEALQFLREHRDHRFFLYYPFNLVHGFYVPPPPDPELPPLELPRGATLTSKERTYLEMIRRLDRDVGRLVAQIDALDLARETLVIFTSDNGARPFGDANDALLDSSGGLRGGKADLYEGGIRIPTIARWPGTIAPHAVTDHPSAFWDFLPTVCELVGQPVPAHVDGVSYLPALLGRPQPAHEYLYWELAKRDEPMVVPQQALQRFPWKLIQRGGEPAELYDLARDPTETTDLASRHPELVRELEHQMDAAHTDDPRFPLEAGPGFE